MLTIRLLKKTIQKFYRWSVELPPAQDYGLPSVFLFLLFCGRYGRIYGVTFLNHFEPRLYTIECRSGHRHKKMKKVKANYVLQLETVPVARGPST